MTESQTRYGQGLIVLLGLFAFASILAFHNITDGDLWGKLAIGASLWEHGHLLRHDVFAFTQTLPKYIEHEWGAGVIFYGVLRFFGPPGLMLLKIVLAAGALGIALAAGRRQGCTLNILLLLAIPAAACLLPGYIPVLRSHVFTFFLFAATLFCLEELRDGRRWPAVGLPLIILMWANVHGGFVVGLAVIFFYAIAAAIQRKNAAVFAGTAVACAAVTFINPYGIEFWKYLIPALLNPRARITEWRPLPLFAWDEFEGFRLLFVLTLAVVIWGWKGLARRNYHGLAILVLTAAMGWRSKRHGPFFAVTALAFAGPYYAAVAAKIWSKFDSLRTVGVIYAGLAFYAALQVLPQSSLQPLAPIGEDPVRETDILSRAGVKGNLACPFNWGCYLTWRLYPNIKVSMDGRYETTYPESTFDLNAAFFDHQGDWLKLCRDYRVDFVILDASQGGLRPEDLTAQGFVLVWKQENISALLCRPEFAAALGETARNLPPYTVDPLDLKARSAAVMASR